MIKCIDDNQLLLELSAQIYMPEALLRTLYKFNHRCFIHIDSNLNHIFSVYFRKAHDSPSQLAELVDQFCRELIEQQIRISTEKDFGVIRDELVKQAFSSVN